VPGSATPLHERLIGLADRLLGAASVAAMLLVLPLALLLFLQWPLRDLVQAGSREANDLAQILFALYVSVAVNEATRRGTHLAADSFAQRWPPRVRIWLLRAAHGLVAVPWSAFVLYAAWPAVLASIAQRESFGETLNPGYFLVRAAVALLAALVLLQAIVDAVRPDQR